MSHTEDSEEEEEEEEEKWCLGKTTVEAWLGILGPWEKNIAPSPFIFDLHSFTIIDWTSFAWSLGLSKRLCVCFCYPNSHQHSPPSRWF